MKKFIFIHTHPIQYYAPLYQYLTSKGMLLEVWYCSNDNIKGSYDAEFGKTLQWDLPLLEGYAYKFFSNMGNLKAGHLRGYNAYKNPELLKALKAHPPAIVVVHGWSYSTYMQVILKAKNYGHALAFRGETNAWMELQRTGWKQQLRMLALKRLFKKVDIACYIGEQSKRFYQQISFPANRMVFTPYAVDNNRFQAQHNRLNKQNLRQQYQLPSDAFVWLFSGKFIAKKRPLDLLASFAQLQQPNAYLVMMGDGPLLLEMQAFIKTKQLENRVLITGFINQQEVAAYYNLADAMVMCSGYGETWGLSVNEAMNAQLPVVVSDAVGCALNLVQPQNGLIFPFGHTTQLTNAMETIMQQTPEALQQMGEASLALVNQHSFAQIHQGLLQITKLTPA